MSDELSQRLKEGAWASFSLHQTRAVDVEEPEGSSSLTGLSLPQAERLIPFWPSDHNRWLWLGLRQEPWMPGKTQRVTMEGSMRGNTFMELITSRKSIILSPTKGTLPSHCASQGPLVSQKVVAGTDQSYEWA